MGISNDWQIIDGLQYTTFSDNDNRYSNNRMLTSESAEKLASAMGWEVVELSDYVQTVTWGQSTYNASNIRLLRPVANAEEDEYNCGIMFVGYFRYYTGSSNITYTNAIIRLSDGAIIGSLYSTSLSLSANAHLFRPGAVGDMCLWFNSVQYPFYIDKFTNVKTEAEKWGIIVDARGSSTPFFIDVYTGLIMEINNAFQRTTCMFSFGGFVSLVKVTAISSSGVYKAKTMYRYLLGYGSQEKTIELDGVKYLNVNGDLFYLRLAE